MTAITIIMSRSYKSTPIFKAHMGYGKKRANRAVRNRMNRGEFDVLPSNSHAWYKRCYEQYDVVDYCSRETYSQVQLELETMRLEITRNGGIIRRIPQHLVVTYTFDPVISDIVHMQRTEELIPAQDVQMFVGTFEQWCRERRNCWAKAYYRK
ncbi:hypothetical protein J8401_011245 [Lactiplantibacillus plantarum]|uniref:hypothetical protein n=2 Tax=Lactiplantibacillus plantarum TaxID=1590 RepID=UPI00156E0378|nr:hypothetical protein [Lactiplantibacillus plantarum]MBP5844827.1 hypothetical protein [Lactiplantibacillus plantarum]MBY7658113.1 hypothetical protein [Lactiplantibacillus plantarum]MCT3233394.1 hypothetical protein [Lactiplantibacillus plantarum]MCT3551474.1 hypothetical protein [Lactiplantibacillus plantarum]QKK60443.1 hypothetical protein HRW02_14100 [Lactiplantibacillus plantarum]